MTVNRKNHGSGHTYYADGIPGYSGAVKLPGVTTILGMVPKPGLIKWAAETTVNYAVDNWAALTKLAISERIKQLQSARFADKDTAARKGIAVHKLAERIIAGGHPEVPEELRGHVDSYRDFIARFKPEAVAIELVVCNREIGYCGTADLVAEMMGKMWLLDIKTSRSGIYAESALQLCAYEHAETFTVVGEGGQEHSLADLGIDRAAAIHVRADGFDVRPLDTGPEVWDYFKHLAYLYHRQEEMTAWVGDAIEPLRAVS